MSNMATPKHKRTHVTMVMEFTIFGRNLFVYDYYTITYPEVETIFKYKNLYSFYHKLKVP